MRSGHPSNRKSPSTKKTSSPLVIYTCRVATETSPSQFSLLSRHPFTATAVSILEEEDTTVSSPLFRTVV